MRAARGSRATIADVARMAGVSKGAASHALNGRPGVSEFTRARVQAAARDLDWSANANARALSGSRAGAIGWVIIRSPKSNIIDPYFIELFAGIEQALSSTDLSLVVKLVSGRGEEEALYRRWASERRVDGVLLTDHDVDDRRPEILQEMGLAVALFSSSLGTPPPDAVPTVWLDETGPVHALLDLAHERGHRRIGWVSGNNAKVAPRCRAIAAEQWALKHRADVRTVFTDYGIEQGVREAVRMVESAGSPTFLILDNDLLALSTMSTLQSMGRVIPDDISLASFVDSTMCSVALPPIAALRHPIVDFGQRMTRLLLDVVDGGGKQQALPAPQLNVRASVGIVPRAREASAR